jgi:hypothetical protein
MLKNELYALCPQPSSHFRSDETIDLKKKMKTYHGKQKHITDMA